MTRPFFYLLLTFCCFVFSAHAQRNTRMQWSADGNRYVTAEPDGLTQTDIRTGQKKVLVAGSALPKPVASFAFSADSQRVLVFTNTARVWRYNTRGDYYVLNRTTGQRRQIGQNRPAQSLMFAKLSPDGKRVAYVSEHNLYVEDVATGTARQLTTDGTRKLINGTFDWAYEEEFGCRDGFRWSPDSRQLAYWQVDARQIRDYLMLNTTDSTYSFVIPVEYPKVGENPSPARIGIVSADGGATQWLNLPGDAQQHYLPRMEWMPNSEGVIIEQLNRKQNQSRLYVVSNGTAQLIREEKNNSWIDVKDAWNDGDPSGWEWLDGGKSFLWVSEKDGWRHLYRIRTDGQGETLLTPGAYDIANLKHFDLKTNQVYFIASPENPTQRYLYRTTLDGKGKAVRITPTTQAGTHGYSISPNGRWAQHSFSSYQNPNSLEWVSLPGHTPIRAAETLRTFTDKPNVRFFQVKTADNVTVDGWMALPVPFDSTKKYPILFYVYGEPAGSTVNDTYGVGQNRLYDGDMAKDGYVYAALDNRGTPTLKGAEWRKAIYRQIGRLNIRDQAQAAQALLAQHSFLDTSRVAVWGWSGGGSSTLNLLFQYPHIYKTGISVASVANQLSYDNIYQERYMGLPQENRDDFVAGSPLTHAKNLRGNLLYIHGTGDDNVHYSNAEQLINALIANGKQFQLMAYPNRSHSISEGVGTSAHLRRLFTNYLRQYCPPGAR